MPKLPESPAVINLKRKEDQDSEFEEDAFSTASEGSAAQNSASQDSTAQDPPQAPPAPPDVQNKTRIGVALSGGGIRSAALSAGMLKSLMLSEKLKDEHFTLSCVSGGGYAGASLFARLAQLEQNAKWSSDTTEYYRKKMSAIRKELDPEQDEERQKVEDWRKASDEFYSKVKPNGTLAIPPEAIEMWKSSKLPPNSLPGIKLSPDSEDFSMEHFEIYRWERKMTKNSSYFMPWSYQLCYASCMCGLQLFMILAMLLLTICTVFPIVFIMADNVSTIALLWSKYTQDYSTTRQEIGLACSLILLQLVFGFLHYVVFGQRYFPLKIAFITTLFWTIVIIDFLAEDFIRSFMKQASALTAIIQLLLFSLLKVITTATGASQFALIMAIAWGISTVANWRYNGFAIIADAQQNPPSYIDKNQVVLGGFPYDDVAWNWSICAALVLWAVHPLLHWAKVNIWFLYYRDCLTRAFFKRSTKDMKMSVEPGSGCRLKYISNVVLNGTIYKYSSKENCEGLYGHQKRTKPHVGLSLDSSGGKVFLKGRRLQNHGFEEGERIEYEYLKDMQINEAMALSAAAFATRLGGKAEGESALLMSLLSLSGLNLGQWVQVKLKSKLLRLILGFKYIFLWLGLIIPLTVTVAFRIFSGTRATLLEAAASLLLPFYVSMSLFVGGLATYHGPRLGRFLRLISTHVHMMPLFKTLLQFMGATEHYTGSDDAIEQVFLTDGGHYENLGILPLLQDRGIGDIFSMDGGQDAKFTCKDLISAMDEARKILGIRFQILPCDPADPLDQGQDSIYMMTQSYPRDVTCIKINYWRPGDGPSDALKTIYYMRGPRSKSRDQKNPNFYNSSEDPNQKDSTGICCNCCVCCGCCKGFPHHSTGNVFMHPRAFRTYLNAAFRDTEKLLNDYQC